MPIPILYESRRKKIQRLLASSSDRLSLLWLTIIKSIVEKEFKRSESLILVQESNSMAREQCLHDKRDVEKESKTQFIGWG